MSTVWNRAWRRGLSLALLVAGVGALPQSGNNRGALAQEADRAVVLPLNRALSETARTGRPSLVVITSTDVPASMTLWRELVTTLSTTDGSRAGYNLTQLSAQERPEDVKKLRVTRYPSVAVYERGATGLRMTASQVAPKDAAFVVGWLEGRTPRMASRSLPPRDASIKPVGNQDEEVKPVGNRDEEVEATGHLLFHHHDQPSPQGYVQEIPQQAAVPQAAPQMLMQVPTQSASVVAAPSSAPVVVSAPTPSIVLQQSAPTVYVAPPAQPANVVLLAPPQALPSVSVVQPSAVAMAAPSQPQLFLASPSAAPPAAVAAPMAAQPVMMQMAAAPAQAQAVQPSAQPMAGIPAGPLGRMIGNLGERLARHKYPRVPGATTSALLAQPAAAAPLMAMPMALQPAQQQQAVSYVAMPQSLPPTAQPQAQSYATPQYHNHGH